MSRSEERTQPDLGDTLVFDDRHAFDLAETVRAGAGHPSFPRSLVKQRIGPFEVKEILGCGGMGVVYSAVADDGSLAAVKVLSTRPHPKDADRFAREATVRIDHPNVVRLLDARVDGDVPYIAFELLEGRDLQARLREEVALSPREAVSIAIQACRGLAAAHDQGVIHRDLKPANIFLAGDGVVKVLDFGIAYVEDRDARLTSTNALMGTPHYMAPEQARGDKTYDARTDVWGLGAVVYHALTGRTPFARESRVATLLAVVTEEVQHITEIAPTVPKDLAAIVERALAKERDDRWPSMQAMLAALEALGPVAAEADPTSIEQGAGIAPGEQRIVAVLMARGIFDRSVLQREVESREGVLVPIVGGQAIGLFGVERWRGDEIERAVEAGLAVRPVVERIAVASGRVEQTGAKVSGGVVRSAEACCDADVDKLALDAAAAQAVAGAYVLHEAQPGVFEVHDRKPKALLTTQLEKLENGAPLFGREAELAQLGRAIRSVLEETRARSVLLRGPVGIGKRRLAQQAVRLLENRARSLQPKLLFARAGASTAGSAFALITEILAGRAELGASSWGWPRLGAEAPLGERQHAVMRLVDEAIADRKRAAICGGFIGRLLGVEMPETPDLAAAQADPRLMQDRLRLALLEYLAGLVDEAPVGLLLEEIQWADPDSLSLLDELFERAADAPLFLLLTARPELTEAQLELLESRSTIELELEGLDRLDVADLARWLAGRPLPEALVDALFERTGGSPLFVEQIVTALKSEGRLDTEQEDLPLPLTVEAAVQSRLDHLESEEKEACRRCSVFGRPFFQHEATALGVAGAPALLKRLVEKKILAMRRKKRLQKGPEFRFRSTLIQDVAYRMLVEERKKPLHARAAAYLAQLPDTDPEELARHHAAAGQSTKAALQYARAAFRAARRGDSRKVEVHVSRALELGAPKEAYFDLAMIRAEALQFLGRHEDRRAAIQLALDHARTVGHRAQALTELVKVRLRDGRPAEAIDAAEEAVAAARPARDPDVLVLALGRQGLALTKAGRLEEATRVLDEADQAAALAPIHLRALIAGWRGQLAGARGDLAGRLAAFERAVALYERAGDPRRAAGAKVNVADVYNRIGDYERAQAALEQALVESRQVHNRPMEGYALVNRAYALTMLDRPEEAKHLLGEARHVAEDIGDQQLELYVRFYRVRARAAADEELGPLADDAEAIAQDAEQRFVALAINAFAKAASFRHRLGENDRAIALSERAIHLLDSVGGTEEDEAEVYLARAQILERDGRTEEARDILSRGRRRLMEAADTIEDQALRDKLLHGVAAHQTLLALSAE